MLQYLQNNRLKRGNMQSINLPVRVKTQFTVVFIDPKTKQPIKNVDEYIKTQNKEKKENGNN